MVAVPWLGWLLAIPLLWRRFSSLDRDLLAIVAAFLVVLFALLPLAIPEMRILVVGLRYVCALLPLAAAVTGLVVARASGDRPLVYTALLLLFGATHLAGNAAPWLAIGESRRVGPQGTFVNTPLDDTDKVLNTAWWYLVRGLGVPNPGTLPDLVSFLEKNAGPDDVVVTNFGWDNLYFYTQRPQGFRISYKAAAVGEAARALGLPDSAFGLDGADWVIWRHGSDPLPRHPFDKVRSELEARGATLQVVASFPETLWENRPELHWHRFPRAGYIFAPARVGPAGRKFPPAIAYRVVRRNE
jgi:hypothetical protein